MARQWAEILLKLVRFAIIMLGIIIMWTSFGYLRPYSAVFIVELEPLGQVLALVSVWTYGISRAFRFAHSAVYALVWVDHQHVVALVETIY